MSHKCKRLKNMRLFELGPERYEQSGPSRERRLISPNP